MTALGTQASEVALLVQAKQLTGSPLAVGLLGNNPLATALTGGLALDAGHVVAAGTLFVGVTAALEDAIQGQRPAVDLDQQSLPGRQRVERFDVHEIDTARTG